MLSSFPRGRIEGNELVIWYDMPADEIDSEECKRYFEGQLKLVEQLLSTTKSECEEFNDKLRNEVRQAVGRRKEKVLKDLELEKQLGGS
ncbi:hypothetical protein HRbin30_03281 [bacterium HR30]|nr:hypothetical protein HRbin30_03281 [bacterium HR30]